MFWYIICLELDHATESFRMTADPAIYNIETYNDANGLIFDPANNGDFEANLEKMIQLMYFAYTTLSTVGFGDKTPRSDMERLIICVILLLGVSLFGYILGIFNSIIEEFKSFDADIDEGNELRMFFSCIKHYNRGIDFEMEKKRAYEFYFEYRWKNNKNSAVDDEDEKSQLQ